MDGSGNVYIADTGHAAIEEWMPSTSGITSLASSGVGAVHGVAVDGLGNVYAADAIVEAGAAFLPKRDNGRALRRAKIRLRYCPAASR